MALREPEPDEIVEEYAQRAFAVPPEATEIICLRHGSSEAAREGEPFPLLDGQGDPALSDEGVAQASRAAARLSADGISGLFVTSLRRTHQTAAPLAAATGLEPVVVPELREVNLGEWEGGEYRIRLHKNDPLIRRVLTEGRWDLIPGAESNEDFAARISTGLSKVVAAAGPGVSVVAVVHGGVIAELCRQATGGRLFAFAHSDNCSITRLVVFPGNHLLLRSFNDISHL